jgi:hypothetical protein
MLSENIAFEDSPATPPVHPCDAVAAGTGSPQLPRGRPLARFITHFRSRLSFAVRIEKTSMIDYAFLFVPRDAKHVFPSLLICCTKVAYHICDRLSDRNRLGMWRILAMSAAKRRRT